MSRGFVVSVMANSQPIRLVGSNEEGQRVNLELEGRQLIVPMPSGQGASSGRQVKPIDLGFSGSVFSSDLLQKRLREKRIFEILTLIRDLDPQVSQAIWNYLRLMNPGHSLIAMNGDKRNETPEQGPAQAFLDELVVRVGAEYGGGLDQLHNVLNLSLITYGAESLEVEPTANLDGVVDWHPVDPTLLAFRRDTDFNLVLGQLFRNGDFVELNTDLVFYQPLDPDIGDPYGRPPMVSAVNAVTTKAAVLADLRAVSHNQGFPRIDVSVVWDAILKAAPPALKADGQQAALAEWAGAQLTDIVNQYQDLEVDDTFVHYDFVQLKMVGGTAPASLGFDFAKLIDILERQLNQALKSLPILQGINESTTETHGSIQWQIQVAGITTLQRLTKRLLEKAGTVSLRLAGFSQHAVVHYEEIRSVDRLYEAQSGLFEAKAHQIAVAQGWEDNDEAAQTLFGHDAVEEPMAAANDPNADVNPNNSGDKTPGAAGNGPGAGGDEVQSPSEVESKAAFDLLMHELDRDAGDFTREVLQVPAGSVASPQARVIDPSSDEADKYGAEAARIFLAEQETLIEELRKEGIELRDPPKDIADYVFGLRYSRAMKALLREALVEGMRRGGLDGDLVADERIVRRIWADNLQYVRKIREELKQALRSGEFQTLLDVRHWFEDRAWREEKMGRYLAKQGLSAGFSAARATIRGSQVLFVWTLSPDAEHCATCLFRSGQAYTHEELISVGFPGSGALECGANCKCVLVEQEPT